MRKWIIGTITTIVLAFVVIFFFVLKNSESNILDKVPVDASSVIVINLKGLSAKLFFDELTSSENNADKIAKLVPDSLIDIDWSVSGINLMDKAIIFTDNNKTNDTIRLNLILPLSDETELSNFVDSLASKINLEIQHTGTIHSAFSPKYRILISWNKNYVVASFLSDNQPQESKFLGDVLKANGNNSILKDSSFTGNLKTDFDIFAYVSSASMFEKKMNSFWVKNTSSLCSFLHFNDGELTIETKIKHKENSLLNQLLTNPKEHISPILESDSTIVFANLNINSTALFKIIDQITSIKFNMQKIPLLLAWDGRASISVNNDKTIENEYISYDYDDDFNKIEVRRKELEKVSDIQTHLGVNQNILDSIFKNNRVLKSNKDTLLFKGSNYILKKADNEYLCYSKYIVRPKLSSETVKENISAFINYNNFIHIIKNNKLIGDSSVFNRIPLKKVEFSLEKKDEIVFKSRFYFNNNKKNALFSIAENFE